jgi:hypothetical protein
MDGTVKVGYKTKGTALCSGDLIVYVNEKEYIFPSHCLSSGGNVWFDGGWNEHVEYGNWRVNNWPIDFPNHLRDDVLNKINDEISHGCCGGCI